MIVVLCVIVLAGVGVGIPSGIVMSKKYKCHCTPSEVTQSVAIAMDHRAGWTSHANDINTSGGIYCKVINYVLCVHIYM